MTENTVEFAKQHAALITAANSRQQIDQLRMEKKLTPDQQKLVAAVIDFGTMLYELGHPAEPKWPPHWKEFFLHVFSRDGAFYAAFADPFLRQAARVNMDSLYELLHICRQCSNHCYSTKSYAEREVNIRVPVMFYDVMSQEAADMGAHVTQYMLTKLLQPTPEQLMVKSKIAWGEDELM